MAAENDAFHFATDEDHAEQERLGSRRGSSIGRSRSRTRRRYGDEDDFEDDEEMDFDDEEDQILNGNGDEERASHQQHWPQSYRQSMDMYSHMASPSIPHIFSPASHRTNNAIVSPHPSLSYRRQSPLLVQSYQQHRPVLQAAHPLPPTLPSSHSHKPPRAPSGEKDGSPADVEDEEEGDMYYDLDGKGSSFMQAMFNGVNVLAGVGVLSTPYALMQGGWLSLLLLLLFAGICCYTALILRFCLESEPGLETYPDIGEAAFGQLGRLLISVVLYVELYACCVEFLILEGDNLGAMFPSLSLDLGLFLLSPRHFFVLISALCILPTMYLRDLSLLSYVSAGGVIASIVVVTSVAVVGVTDVGFHHESGPLLNLWGLPVTIGLFGFCYSGHAVFPNIYSSMERRQDYNKVLYCSFALCTAIYGGMAVMGYSMFGSSLEAQITLNLPPHHFASKLAIWTTVVNPFTKFAISMTPVALSLEELLPFDYESPSYRNAALSIRTALVASTVAVALLIPFFGYVMAFIGSFLSMTVSIILPCACYLRILGKRATRFQTGLCYLLMLIGLVCAVAGTYSSIEGIINSFKHPTFAPPPSPTNLFSLPSVLSDRPS